MINIDLDRCKRDRICAAECPMMLIGFKDRDAYPAAVLGAEELCIKCGHCVSVCPYEAISLADLEPGDCETVLKDSLPSQIQVEAFLKSRRSIRRFKPQPVDLQTLTHLIDIARFAPTGHNSQTVHWLVIKDPVKVQDLAGLTVEWMKYMIDKIPEVAASMHMDEIVAVWDKGVDRICRNAPHIIMAHGPSSIGTTAVSCSIALTYLELAAYSLGLGACWAGYLGSAAASFPPLTQMLKLPEGHKVYGAMMIGYPRYSYHRIPPRVPARVTWQ